MVVFKQIPVPKYIPERNINEIKYALIRSGLVCFNLHRMEQVNETDI